MKTLSVFVLVVLCAAFAEAQPWQWEQYQGDFYNPTAFPDLGNWDYGEGAVGDFDGNGRDDFLYGIYATVCDTDRFHWTTFTMTQAPTGYNNLAINLDGDAADEIITFSPGSDSVAHAWKLISSNLWSWQQRDDLLAGLFFPPGTRKAVVGDYDGDGLLNAVCWKGHPSVDTVRLYTRQSNGAWQSGTVFYTYETIHEQLLNIIDGDFDQDGDLDFGIMTEPPADPVVLWGYYYENTGDGIASPVQSTFFSAGGDLDGDGDWEGLEQMPYRFGYNLAHTAPDASFFHVTNSTYLGRFDGRVFGNLRVNGQSVVAGVYNCTQTIIWPNVLYSFWVESCSSLGWKVVSCGFSSDFWLHCSSACLADLDGDGHRDLLASVNSTSGGVSWRIYQNTGTDSTDLFNAARALPSSIPSVRTTVQIGDISGDGRAELAVLTPTTVEPQVFFYEMIGEIADTNFVLHSDWSSGLPSALNFRLADIDNDGICEALLYNGATWDSYFFRNGHWDLYTDILPNVTANDISFADANNDGNLDLFTADNVWLNLSPDAADRNFILHPSSFILSCFPNPFNARTEIRFSLPQAGKVSLDLFDILGRQVAILANGTFPPGEHSVLFDGSNLGSGIYFARLSASHHQTTLKVMLIR